MNFKIYKATNKITNKSYIGFTSTSIEKRKARHLRSSLENSSCLFHKSIRKHGIDSFIFEEIDIASGRKDAVLLEIHYIHKFDTHYISGTGYNMTYGGEGTIGHKHTKKIKQLLSFRSKENWKEIEFLKKQKKNKRNLGKKQSEEMKMKMIATRIANNSFIHSTETKKKLSEIATGKRATNTKYWLMTRPDGIKEIVSSMRDYCIKHNIDNRLLHKVAKGENTHHKGFKCSEVMTPKINILSVSREWKYENLPKTGLLIYNTEFQEKRDIIDSIVRAKNNFYAEVYHARKCVVQEIDSKLAREFLDTNHIQGFTAANVYLALYKSGSIVALMCFSKSRFDDSIEWELSRFCNKLNSRVMGGASKLLTNFIKKYNVKSMTSYADKRFFSGTLYDTLGFVKEREIKPDYKYVHKKDLSTMHRKEHFRHDKMKDKLIAYESEKSEFQNMALHGYHRIYDLGKIKYNLILKPNSKSEVIANAN